MGYYHRYKMWTYKRRRKKYAKWQQKAYFTAKGRAKWHRQVQRRKRFNNFIRGYWRR